MRCEPIFRRLNAEPFLCAVDVTPPQRTHQLDGELSAGRAVVLAVAGMACGMCAWMDTRARFAAFGRPRTAGDRRVHDHRSTRTRQLVEAHARTRLAVSAVA